MRRSALSRRILTVLKLIYFTLLKTLITQRIMDQKAFQDYYPDQFNYCYGCGQLNEHGLQIRSFWDGDETVCLFQPRPYHTAIPGYVYGGLIASLIDCR